MTFYKFWITDSFTGSIIAPGKFVRPSLMALSKPNYQEVGTQPISFEILWSISVSDDPGSKGSPMYSSAKRQPAAKISTPVS